MHFDFGEALRACVENKNGLLTAGEYRVVEDSLRTGALLEDWHFSIAKKLLVNHLEKRKADSSSLIVLNGIPRHTGQAESMKAVTKMQAIINLECCPAAVWERIQVNAGGDREGRMDDTLEGVEQRLRVFRERTAPLLNYYRNSGVPVLPIDVGAQTTARELRTRLEAVWQGIIQAASHTNHSSATRSSRASSLGN